MDTELGGGQPVRGAGPGLGGGEGEDSGVPQAEYRGHGGQEGEDGAEEDTDDLLQLNFSLAEVLSLKSSSSIKHNNDPPHPHLLLERLLLLL